MGLLLHPYRRESRLLNPERMTGQQNQPDGAPPDASREAAKEIEHQHPGWMVVWGVYPKHMLPSRCSVRRRGPSSLPVIRQR